MKDNRLNTEVFAATSPYAYLEAYLERLSEALRAISPASLDRVFEIMKETAQKKRRIYVAGNGGSCAIAAHLCCDWMKGATVDGHPPLKTHTLGDNVSLLTALANDIGYDHCFSQQLEWVAEEGDVALLISSSGNSPNVVKAAEVAKKKKMRVIGFTGFTGGKLKELSDVCLHIPVANFGIAEDSHQMLMHILSQYLYKVQAKL